jgi:hypothetical protein
MKKTGVECCGVKRSFWNIIYIQFYLWYLYTWGLQEIFNIMQIFLEMTVRRRKFYLINKLLFLHFLQSSGYAYLKTQFRAEEMRVINRQK